MKKLSSLLLACAMLLALAACGMKNNDKMGDMSGNGSAMTGEPKTAEEALALHKELLERENALLSENTELWEKVFMEADKGMAMVEDGKNYGDFLLDTIETAKEQFADKEYEWLKESATEISNIENKLTELEEKYPEIMQKSMDGDMSMPAGDDMSMPSDQSGADKAFRIVFHKRYTPAIRFWPCGLAKPQGYPRPQGAVGTKSVSCPAKLL